MKTLNLSLIAVALLIFAGNVNAELIQATGVTTDGTVVSPGGVAAASDGNTNGPVGDVYTDKGGTFPEPGSDYFIENGGVPLLFEFDLGSAYMIDSIAFWNRGSAAHGNSTKNFDVTFSTDATFGNGDDVVGGSFVADSISAQQDFAVALGGGSFQYVQISITDNYGGDFAGGDRVAFNEVQFNTVEASVLGDVNLDGVVDFSDISPFIAVLSGGGYQAEADCDEDGLVNFSDISPFIAILSGS